jgi:hypothetical protein
MLLKTKWVIVRERNTFRATSLGLDLIPMETATTVRGIVVHSTSTKIGGVRSLFVNLVWIGAKVRSGNKNDYLNFRIV